MEFGFIGLRNLEAVAHRDTVQNASYHTTFKIPSTNIVNGDIHARPSKNTQVRCLKVRCNQWTVAQKRPTKRQNRLACKGIFLFAFCKRPRNLWSKKQ